MYLLLVCSIVLNVMLASRLQRYRERSVRTQSIVGRSLPPLNAKTLSGRDVTVTFDRPTILYILSPSCAWCDRNVSNIRYLAAAVAQRYRVIGLSTSRVGLEAKLSTDPLPFTVYTDMAPGTVEALRPGGTPRTIVVASGGTVMKVWVGAYGGPLQAEIESYFGTSLPGLVGYPVARGKS